MLKARTRVIPCLLLKESSLVKTVSFKEYNYIGDPINTVRIFNEFEVDELMFLDITATKQEAEPDYALLEKIASECFMPLAYGGGIKSFDQAKRIFSIGFEKVVLNSICFLKPELLTEISDFFGSQAVIASIDYKKGFFGGASVFSDAGTKRQKESPVQWAKRLEALGAGEILLTSIDRDGTWSGYDLQMTRDVSSAVSIPVVASGGAGKVEDLKDAVKTGGASAVAVGSMVVYQKKDMGVLINFPDKRALKEIF